MIKLIKHEFKDTARFVVPLLIALAGFTTYFALKGLVMGTLDEMIVIILMMVIMVIAILLPLVFLVVYVYQSFSKRVFSQEGYLTLTLPLSSYQIVGAKYLTVLIWMVIVSIVTILLTLLLFSRFMTINELKGIANMLMEDIGLQNIFSFKSLLLSLAATSKVVFLIWFALTIANIGFFKRFRLSSFVLVVLFLYLNTKINALFPMNLEQINYTQIILDSSLAILLFVATSYLLENKVDLT